MLWTLSSRYLVQRPCNSRFLPSLSLFISRSCSTTPFTYLTQERVDHAIYITLNRPDVHNAFNQDVIAEITQSFQNIEKDVSKLDSLQAPRVVVLTGNGASFSAGADLSWMRSMLDYPKEANEADAKKLFDMVNAIKSCPIPTIARINGAALGGGSGLVAACDIPLALESSIFGFTEVSLGILPAVISRFVMEKIGKGNCSRYFLTGERFSAKVAMQIGLVSGVYDDLKKLDTAVSKMVKKISNNSPNAVRTCKTLIEEVSCMNINDSRDFVSKEISRARISSEGQEGLKSFLDKRRPKW